MGKDWETEKHGRASLNARSVCPKPQSEVFVGTYLIDCKAPRKWARVVNHIQKALAQNPKAGPEALLSREAHKHQQLICT